MSTGHHDRFSSARRSPDVDPCRDRRLALYPAEPEPGRGPRREMCRFPARPAAVAEIRSWTRTRLAARRLDPDALDLATLLISEIAGNAVLHAHGHNLIVRLTVDGELEAAVHDQDRQHRPQVVDPSPDGLHGRGLALVEALTADWGTDGDSTGKWVWFRLAL